MIAIILSGCLKMEQTLTVNEDGSADMKMSYAMQETTIAQMEAMNKMSQQMAEQMGEEAESDNDSFEFNEEAVRSQYEKLEPAGIKLKSVNSEVRDGWKYIHVEFTADSLSALGESEAMEGSNFSLTRNVDGNYVLVLNNESGQGMGGDSEDMTPEMKDMMMQSMLPMMKGMRIEVNVVVPTEVIESNATQTDGNKVSWVYDVDKDPSFITEMDKMSMRVVFNGDGLDFPDVQAIAVMD
jgi:hypothetical protein